jgi:aspartyl/asparaginyl beta-hydroxylase (cupin superfamily)
MFSALAPGAHIPPHTGETNARLVAHLPLVVPEDCHFRVGYDWKQWREGKCWVFDDTLEHEARNDSSQLRVILMFDVWNPLLSLAERDMVESLSLALNDYRTQRSEPE